MLARVVPADHIARPIGGAADPQIDLETYAQEICALHHPDPHRPVGETRANARLISAAPDLLIQLRGLVAAFQCVIADLGIDEDATTLRIMAGGSHVAEVPVATLLANANAALAKAEVTP